MITPFTVFGWELYTKGEAFDKVREVAFGSGHLVRDKMISVWGETDEDDITILPLLKIVIKLERLSALTKPHANTDAPIMARIFLATSMSTMV